MYIVEDHLGLSLISSPSQAKKSSLNLSLLLLVVVYLPVSLSAVR